MCWAALSVFQVVPGQYDSWDELEQEEEERFYLLAARLSILLGRSAA